MLEGLSEEDSSNALAQLSEIDWSNWNALEQAEEILKSFGKNIDITSDYWIEFADNMRVASGAVEDFGQIINSL
jgi:hypothetical protein